MIIKGIDGGLATGIAYWDTESQYIVNLVETGNAARGVRVEFDETEHYDVLVAETFQLRAGNKFLADLSTVEVNGWLKGDFVWDNGVAPNVHKTFNGLGEKDPKAKSPITLLMKEQGWKIGEGHTRDALSIAFWYACVKLKDRATIATYQRLKGK